MSCKGATLYHKLLLNANRVQYMGSSTAPSNFVLSMNLEGQIRGYSGFKSLISRKGVYLDRMLPLKH